MMSSTDDDPSTVNGRLRPRKSSVPGTPRARSSRKSDPKPTDEKPKKSGTPSKKAPEKSDDSKLNLPAKKTPEKTEEAKSNAPSHLKVLCPYCDKKFASKKSVSKHVGRIHINPSKRLFIECLYCKQTELDSINIIRHMVDSHPNQYFACLDCHTRLPSTSELAIHKLNVCEKPKHLLAKPYRNKLRQKIKNAQKNQKSLQSNEEFRVDDKRFTDAPGFNGIVISCELKPSQVQDPADIEENITTNLILPPNKNIVNGEVLEKNAVIVLDDIQWNKRIPPNFSFHNSDTDQILSRLGVVHRSPRTSEHTRRDLYKQIEDSTKFERCFDTTFYSKVAGNVQENLTKFLEGSFNRFHIDPENIIKTRKPKNNINTAEGFPILLASEQYSRNLFESYMPRAIAPRHKWKWDSIESDRCLLNPDQIKRDSHVNNCIITLVSSLDIWTQLRMRLKFEAKFNNTSYNEKKTEKQSIVSNELKEILESRVIPKQPTQVVKIIGPKTIPERDRSDFPSSLGLMPATPKYELPPAVLSGEWTRPRCYVCCACGARENDSRALNLHIATQHPMAQVSHYEVVGECLLNADILKHLYVPPSQPVNKTRPIRGIRNECTKCKKPIGQDELHQHMLECAGDTPVVRRKVRSRPFGVRRRRPRLPDNTIRKKIRKRIRTRQARQKVHMRPRPRIRTEVGDAETIRKMLADLPAKRHRVVINPNQNMRPLRRREQTRNKIMMKRLHSDDPNKTRKLRGVKDTPTSSKSEVSTNDAGNSSKDIKNTASKPKARVVNKVMRKTEALRRKTLMRQAKRKAHAIIKQTASNENAEDKRANTVSSSAVQTDDISLDNSSPDRINVNKSTGKTRSHAARDNANHKDGRKPAGNDQDRGQNTAPPTTNVPLKHSIASLTANTETHDKSVQFQPHFLVHQECYKNVERYRSAGQPTLFENETGANKVDKPPLEGPSQKFDPYALQKSKDKQKRKGLNACIAMLKNKQKVVEPENEEVVVASGHRSVQCDTADMPQYEDPPMPPVPAPEQIDVNTETAYPGQESAPSPAAPYSPAPAHVADYLPLDLSGKPPSHKPTDYSSQTLDLSNKNRDIEPIAAAPEHVVLQEEEHDAVDLSINTPDIGVTLDLSKGPKNKNEDLPHNFVVPPIQQSDAFRNHGYSSIGPSQDYTIHQIEQLDLTQKPSHSADGPSHDYTAMHAQPQMELPTRHRYDQEVTQPEYAARSAPHVDLHKRPRYAEHILSQDLNPAQQTDLTQRQRLKEHDITQGYPVPTGHQIDLSQRPVHRNDILPQNYATMQMQQPIQQLDIPQRYKEDSPAYAQDYTTSSSQPMHHATPYMANEHMHSHDFTVPPQSHYETNKLRKHRHKERASMPLQDFISSPAEQLSFDVTKTQRSDDIAHFQQFDAQPLSSQLDLSQRPRTKDVQQQDSRDSLHKPRHEVLPQEYHDLSNKKRHRSILPQENSIKLVEMDIHNKSNYIEDRDTSITPIQQVDATTKLSLSPKDCPAQPIELVQKVEPIAVMENIQTINNVDVIDPVLDMRSVPPVQTAIKDMPTIKPLKTIESISQMNPVAVGPKPLTQVTEAVPHMKPVQIIEPVVQAKSVPGTEPVRQKKPVQVIEPVPQAKPVLAKDSGVSKIKNVQKTDTILKTKPGRKNVTAKQTKKTKRKKTKEKGGSQKPIASLIEQIDLSKEDTDEDIKVPLTSFIQTVTKKEPEAKETTEVIDAKGIDKSQTKPVYDPTLKIPQYKIRVTEANSTSSDTPSVATSASNDLITPSPIASLANAIREYANAMNMSTVSSIGPTHRSQTTSPPLFTEAGTSTSCLATNTAPTGSLGALIATTSTPPTSIGAELDSERSQIVVPITSVQDLEIAKKIAMLPKEIVEILGRMPTDHRNQLLNILPQYMMYNTSVKQLKLVVDISPDAISKSKMNKSEIATQTSCSVEPACPPEFLNVDTEKYLIDPVTGALTERKEKDLEPELIAIPEVIQQDKVLEIIEDELKDTKKDEENRVEPKTNKQPEEIPLNLTETNNEPTFITPPALAVPLPKSKEPNEKTTASLRAVRIKQSERRKSQLLAAKSNEQPLPVAGINSSVSINLEVGKSKPLAIQQAEVSSTQHSSNRNVMVDSVVPLVTKENEAKVTTNNKERRISTGIDDRDANNAVSLQSVETVPEKVAVDLKPLISETKRPRRTSKRKEKALLSVLKDDQHSAHKLVDVTPKSLTTDSILPSKQTTDPISTDVCPQDINLKVVETTPEIDDEFVMKKSNEIHNEDDSDDDISLAVIVKQKQLIEKNMPTILIDEISQDNEFSKKKGKGKRQNKFRKAADNLEKNTLDVASNQNKNLCTENVDEKTIPETGKSDHLNKNTSSDVPTLITENIETVPKRRKGRRNVVKEINDQPTDIALTDISIISPKIKHKEDTAKKQVIQIALIPIDKKLQTESNKVGTKVATTEKINEDHEPLISKKFKTLPNLPIEDIPENRMQLSPNDDVDNKKNRIVENIPSDVNEEPINSKMTINQVKKNRRKTKHDTEVEEFTVVHDIRDDNVATKKPLKDGLVPQKSIEGNKQVETFPVENIVNKPMEPNKEVNIDKPVVNIDKNISDDEISKSKRFRRSKNKDSPQLQVADDMFVLQWADDMQPLRRSRRGKSMYVEHEIESQEHTPVETVVENRAPYTKKQLIFSKLLLDEENAKAPSVILDNIPDVPKTKESNIKIPELNKVIIQKECNVKIQKEEINIQVECDIIAVKKSDTSASVPDQQSGVITETVINPDKKYSITGKRNTIKRRKPPQRNLSNKKQKSESAPDRDLLTDNENVTAEINTRSPEKYEKEVDILPVQDCAINIEVINNESDKPITNYIPNYKLKEHNKENDITEPASKEQNAKRIDKTHTDSNNFNMVKEKQAEAIATFEPNEISPDVVPKKIRGRKKGNRSLEKRKIGNQIITPAFQSSSPKKTKKLHDSRPDTFEVDLNIEKDAISDELKREEDNLVTAEDNIVKTTPCYDMPKAATRTRSKSVLIKSLQIDDVYDPYNIDLEEKFLQNIEPISKKPHKPFKSIPSVTSINIPQEQLNKPKKPRTVSATEISSPATLSNPEQVTADTNGAEINSDTDDSTKSDIPLKNIKTNKKHKNRKDLEDAVICEKPSGFDEQANRRKRKNLATIKRKRQQVDSVAEDTPEKTEDNAKELRSEQFMESFGFFSERKPRKSNLLASKKISETFHIIASENEDLDYDNKEKERTIKRRNEDRDREREKEREHERIRSPSLSVSDSESNQSISRQIPHCIARRKKGKRRPRNPATYCQTCDKEFRRADNLVRHHLSLFHISRLLKKEMDVDIEPIKEEPNFLLVYKQHLERLKRITERIARKNKKLGIDAPPKIRMPTFAEIMSDVRVQAYSLAHHTRRGLSRDEALFLHCCEMLKESHTTAEIGLPPDLEPVHRLISEERGDCKSDGDVDSITAKNILESEEVRNLENDFITGLKETLNVADDASVTTLKASDECLASTSRGEASKLSAYNLQHVSTVYTQQIPATIHMMPFTVDDSTVSASVHTVISQKPEAIETKSVTVHKKPKSAKHRAVSLDDKMQPRISSDSCPDTTHTKSKCSPKEQDPFETVDDDYVEEPVVKKSINRITEILEFDMFEDKFDKIKRKCRSQTAAQSAAAATTKPSQPATVVEQKSHKTRKKAEKKIKKSSKKSQSMILTKGALKGFDGIKVSIPTSDINMSAIIPDSPPKKKKKSSGKKKRSKRDSESSFKYESEERRSSPAPCSSKQKDIYEFEDNEDDMFEFRPTTMKERFKTLTKESPRMEPRSGGDTARGGDDQLSGSDDGDDFVYMSDDYLCSPSADETEASVDVDSGKLAADPKRSASFKRKDVVEKNAVMGKIFKNNAVKKFSAKGKEPVKSSTANLDQLFDSLLEDEPNSSMLKDDSDPMLASSPVLAQSSPPKNVDHDTLDSLLNKSPEMIRKSPDTISTESSERPMSPPKSRGDGDSPMLSPPRMTYRELLNMPSTSRAPPPSLDDYYAMDPGAERRHRARRKCTVGKQNVLAETWSSESEVEVGGAGGEERRRRGPRKGLQHRRPKQVTFKKQEESRVQGVSASSSSVSSQSAGVSVLVVGSGGGGGGSGGVAGAEWGAPAPQHGWIVGNSHKKLVTMLAHAKGRKRDDKRPYVE